MSRMGPKNSQARSQPTILVTGQYELMEKLKLLPDKVFKRGLLQAGKKSLKPVVAAAKAAAPVESGQLRASIGVKVKVYKRDGNVAFVVGPRSGFAITYQGRPRDPVYYAHIIEKGRKQVAAGSLKLRRGSGRATGVTVPAMPFLRPALINNGQAVISLLATNLGAFVEREAKKAAKA